ncbi:hypothetical protein RN001_005600 [Aquatica leii]|uniref:Uncharacterized protein n=1 Tax=Aquatica leii TaxID=1421715 RepID=A0AAN7PH92_9COLE|nr:hypothetical protein RN001_005600 [Aquatica leii]
MSFKFFDLMDSLFSKNPEIHPVAECSSMEMPISVENLSESQSPLSSGTATPVPDESRSITPKPSRKLEIMIDNDEELPFELVGLTRQELFAMLENNDAVSLPSGEESLSDLENKDSDVDPTVAAVANDINISDSDSDFDVPLATLAAKYRHNRQVNYQPPVWVEKPLDPSLPSVKSLNSQEFDYQEISTQKTIEWINNNDFHHFPSENNENNLQEITNNSIEGFKKDKSQNVYENHVLLPINATFETVNENLISSPNSTESFTIIPASYTTVDDENNDRDFDINDFQTSTSNTSSSSETNKSEKSIVLPLTKNIVYSRLKPKENERKKVRCKYCENDVDSKNLVRHLERHHKEEYEVQKLLQTPKNSKERRFALRTTRPVRQVKENKENEYFACAYCKGIFLKNYLKRHCKSCAVKKEKDSLSKNSKNSHHLSCSQTVTACAMDPTNVISKLTIKEQVFNLMKPDQIAFEAKKDLLIAHIGESYLKKHKRERMTYAASNKMRELSRLLIVYRNLVKNENITFKDIIHPKNFDIVVTAVREMSGYDHERKIFKAPSLAMHIGTSLKLASDELVHLILRESKVSDIKKFRDGVLKIANECKDQLSNNNGNEKVYKLLVQSALALLILFNRRRIGDVQYLKIQNYLDDKRSNTKDFENALTDAEKILTTQYKRVVNSGKGNRGVVILVPDVLQKFVNLILEHRSKYIPADNVYVFAMPGSTIKWGKGDVAIKKEGAVFLENLDDNYVEESASSINDNNGNNLVNEMIKNNDSTCVNRNFDLNETLHQTEKSGTRTVVKKK